MEKKIVKGTIKELGQSSTMEGGPFTQTTYSYIEMADGQMLKQAVVSMGLDGKLKQAVANNEAVELYTFHTSYLLHLVGVQMGGRLYAQAFPLEAFSAQKNNVRLVMVLGVITTPFFGLGLIVLWYAMKLRAVYKPFEDMDAYVKQLPNAIVL